MMGKNTTPQLKMTRVEGAGVWRLIAVSPSIPSRCYFPALQAPKTNNTILSETPE